MKYLIPQELTQAEFGWSGCSRLRSNPRVGREIRSGERMGQKAGEQGSTGQPLAAGSAGLLWGG